MSVQNKKPVVLVILDGWGFSKKKIGNPIASASKPTIDMLTQRYPMTLLQASGLAVGMTWGESGNSEVGHLNIGAGRIVEQYLSRISRAVQDGSFFINEALVGAFSHAAQANSRVHLAGLLTSGTAHADFSHIVALLGLARQKQWPETYLHLFLDGKDSGLKEAPVLLTKLRSEIEAQGFGKIASLIGRNFAMDRDNNWDLTRRAYELLANASGEKSDDYLATIQNYYSLGRNDSTMTPIVVANSNFSGIAENDAIIFFNFREDSMRQILKPFVEKSFSLFPVKKVGSYICTMTEHLENSAAKVAFTPPVVTNGLAEMLESSGKKQLHIAETEKYAHVTYFFNGLKTEELSGEVDIFIESNKDHEKEPAMKSREIAQRIAEELDKNLHDFIILNFANADTLAHTGNFEATVKGIEAIDSALELIFNAVITQKDAILIVTADHGNAESLVYRSSGEAETRHDDNPVPFYLVGREYQTVKIPERVAQETGEASGILGDIAPTILELLEISQPEEMTGKSLLPILVEVT